MRILAIEQSTQNGSIALLNNKCLVMERTWHEARFHSQQAFAILRDHFSSLQGGLEKIELFVVGLGPGAYSGLRMALAMANAAALPCGSTVAGISSGAALAWETMEATGAEQVLTIGDARRQHFWLARFHRKNDFPVQTLPWTLASLETLPHYLAEVPHALIVSPDWHRIGPSLRSVAADSENPCIEESRIPLAHTIGTLVYEQRQRGLPSEPVVPLYLHPAVTIAPRFDSSHAQGVTS